MPEEKRLIATIIPKIDQTALSNAVRQAFQEAFTANINVSGSGVGGGGGGGGSGSGGNVSSAVGNASRQAGSGSGNGVSGDLVAEAASAELEHQLHQGADASSDTERRTKSMLGVLSKMLTGSQDVEDASERKRAAQMQIISAGVSKVSGFGMSVLQGTFGVLEDIYGRLKAASPLLQTIESLFNLAMQLFFMPIGNKLAEVILPATLELVDAVVDMWDKFEGKTLPDMIEHAITEGVQIIGGFLIDIVVQPVGKKEIGVAPPPDHRLPGGVVPGIVVGRHGDGQPLVPVPPVFVRQGVAVILRVSGDEYLPSAFRHGCIDSSLVREREDFQLRLAQHCLSVTLCIPGMRNIEDIIKTTEKHRITVNYPMRENTEKLSIKPLLTYTEMMIKPRLSGPADMEDRVHMAFGPIHDAAQFFPVLNLFEIHILHRSSCDDHSIEILMLYGAERLVERKHVLFRCIPGNMAFNLDKRQLDLQGCIAQETRKLCLSRYLRRHEIEKSNT